MNKKMFSIAVIVLLIDQITKALVASKLVVDQSVVVIKKFFYLTYTYNYGGAWSILNDHSIMLVIISFIALVILFRFMFLFKNNLRNSIAFGLIVGGTCGNLLDRLIYGYVRDFLNFYIFKYNYPVFNIADICIVGGIILLIFAIIKGEDRHAVSSKK